MVDLKLYSFNVRGIRDKVKRKILFNHFVTKYPNGIYLLQETHSTPDIETTWCKEWQGKMYFSHGTNDSCGVALLISKDIDINVCEVKRDTMGRFLSLKFSMDDEEFQVVNIYAPTRNHVDEQLKFLKYIKDECTASDCSNMILGGDYNTIFDVDLDKQGGSASNCTNSYTDELVAFMDTFELIDVIRFKYPERKIFTRIQRSPPVLTRIDHWLMSSHLSSYLNNANVFPGIKSDHSIIYLYISTSKARRGRGFWKFNPCLLKDKEYVDLVKNLILEMETETLHMTDKQVRWDFIKFKIHDFSIKYAATKKREKNEFKMKLEKDLYDIENDIQNGMSSSNVEKYFYIKEELEKIEEHETQNAILRSRVRWAEAGEKNTKYFLNLEKRNAVDKHICQLQLTDGTLTSDPACILNEQKKFYQNLYSGDLSTSEDFSQSTNFGENIKTLSDEEKQICEGLISEQECTKALKQMQNGKSPGTDGFVVDFYKFFWLDIKVFVLESLNYAFYEGELSVNQKQGIITLIPKKGKIKRLLKNWRPITLLNTDYKILTKCLAIRLQQVLPSIINCDQNGFMKDRYIGENIRTIADLIEYTSLKNHPGIVLLLDFEKAFDTIKWSFIIKSLQLFNFGKSFISWIQTVYKNTESTVMNFGNTCGFFKLSRGIRQGCPISPYLFIIAVEILACAIRNDTSIHGIRVDNTEFKISQLADDTSLFLKDFKSLNNVLKLVDEFYNVSGLRLNVNKTIGKCIGSLTDCEPPTQHGIQWTKGPLHTLGITISNDINVILKENFMPRLKVFDNTLNIWYTRGLSLKGKVTILKSLALPKILYPMSVLPVPEPIVDIVDNMIIDFLWSKKRPKVKRDVVIQSIENGGLKVPCFATMVEANRISWVKRLLNKNDSKWKLIFTSLMEPMCPIHFAETPLDKNTLDNIPLTFYKQVFNVWNKYKSAPQTKHDILEQVLWNNKFIQLPSGPKKKTLKSLFWVDLYRAGIVKVKDIISQDGQFLDLNMFCREHGVKHNFIQIARMKKAVPKEWVNVIQKDKDTRINPQLHDKLLLKVDSSSIDILKNSTKSKQIYDLIVTRKYVHPTAVSKWNESFNIVEADWKHIFSLPYCVARETKLQSLQYRILHRIVPCKKWLYVQTVIDSPNCTVCNEVDDILHYFVDCTGVRDFWYSLERWWNNLQGYEITLTSKHIIFGIYYDKYYSNLNYIILLAKWYINRQHCMDQKIDFYNFLYILKDHLRIEEYICIRGNNTHQFGQKWKKIADML